MVGRIAGKPAGRRFLWSFVAVIVTMLSSGGTTAGAEGVDLQVVAVHDDAFPSVELVVSPPSAADLPAGAFSVRQDGRALPFSVEPVADLPLEVALVLDASDAIEAADWRALQGAAVELVLELPENATVAVLSTTGAVLPQPPSRDKARALEAIGGVQPGPARPAPGAVAAGLDELTLGPSHRRAIVVFTAGSNVISGSSADPVVGAVSSRHIPVHSVVLQGAAAVDPALDELAAATYGRVLTAPGTPGLVAAVDDIVGSFDHQYALTFAATQDGAASVDVTVTTAGGQLDAQVRVAPEPTEPPATGTPAATSEPSPSPSAAAEGRSGDDGNRTVVWLVIGLLGLALAAASVAVAQPLGGREGLVALVPVGMGGAVLALAAVGLARGGIHVAPAIALGTASAVAGLGPLRAAVRWVSRARFQADLAQALRLTAARLVTGYELNDALRETAPDVPWGARRALRALASSVEAGNGLLGAARHLRERCPCPGSDWLVVALKTCRGSGDSLPAVLEAVAVPIEDESDLAASTPLYRRDAGLVAIASLLPLLAVTARQAVDPSFLPHLTDGVVGSGALAASLVASVAGMWWVSRIQPTWPSPLVRPPAGGPPDRRYRTRRLANLLDRAALLVATGVERDEAVRLATEADPNPLRQRADDQTARARTPRYGAQAVRSLQAEAALLRWIPPTNRKPAHDRRRVGVPAAVACLPLLAAMVSLVG